MLHGVLLTVSFALFPRHRGRAGGKNLVVNAFKSKAVQVGRKEAEEVLRERNMTGDERRLRDEAEAAAVAAEAAAVEDKQRQERAAFFYARGQGHRAVKLFAEAHQDFLDALEHCPGHQQARAGLLELRSSGCLLPDGADKAFAKFEPEAAGTAAAVELAPELRPSWRRHSADPEEFGGRRETAPLAVAGAYPSTWESLPREDHTGLAA